MNLILGNVAGGKEMVTEGNGSGNGQSDSNKTEKHPYIMVVDREEEMVLIIKHALEMETEGHLTTDDSLDESSIAQKIRRLFNKLSPTDQSVATDVTPLSPRQTQILNQIAKGYPNKLIAHYLGISEQTVGLPPILVPPRMRDFLPSP